MELVRSTLQNASAIQNAAADGAIGLSSVVKYFQRLGDGVSIALLKLTDERDLTNVQENSSLARKWTTSPSDVSEARINERVRTERDALARFRYIDLKGGGRGCGGRGPMEIEWSERVA
jgi:hypothetical protein